MAINEELAKAVEADLIKQGRIIEGGWIGLKMMAYNHLNPVIAEEFRNVFFAGACHSFFTMMSMMDSSGGEEPTEEDVHRMTKLHEELEGFYADFKRRHGIPD